MSLESRDRDDRILILAPTDRESELAATVLEKAGLTVDVCRSSRS